METIRILAVCAIVVLLIMVLKLNKFADKQSELNTFMANAYAQMQQEHGKLLMIAERVDMHTLQIKKIEDIFKGVK